jgi:hypothetical protein
MRHCTGSRSGSSDIAQIDSISVSSGTGSRKPSCAVVPSVLVTLNWMLPPPAIVMRPVSDSRRAFLAFFCWIPMDCTRVSQ